MTDADNRLKALFGKDEPSARDPLFVSGVMATLARRRFLSDLAGLAGVTILGALILWAVWPELASVIQALGPELSTFAAALVVAATAVVLADGHVTSALGLKHD